MKKPKIKYLVFDTKSLMENVGDFSEFEKRIPFNAILKGVFPFSPDLIDSAADKANVELSMHINNFRTHIGNDRFSLGYFDDNNLSVPQTRCLKLDEEIKAGTLIKGFLTNLVTHAKGYNTKIYLKFEIQ